MRVSVVQRVRIGALVGSVRIEESFEFGRPGAIELVPWAAPQAGVLLVRSTGNGTQPGYEQVGSSNPQLGMLRITGRIGPVPLLKFQSRIERDGGPRHLLRARIRKKECGWE